MGSIISSNNVRRQISENNSANKRTRFQGDHETHVFDGSEGELHTRNAVCEKNPGHTQFIPVDKFTLEHLPEDQRDIDLYDLIKATADLTVRVNVKMTSPHRPQFWLETNDPYPFYNMSEPEVLRTGSGMVYDMYKYRGGVDQSRRKHKVKCTKCPCTKCQQSDSPSNRWSEFIVYTAAHVVFDSLEANHTTLKMFYDSKDSPAVIVDAVSAVDVNIVDDVCKLICVTCDTNLGDKLEKMLGHYKNVWLKLWHKYKNHKSVDKVTFIVSHPHGCTKQVSVGQWLKELKVDEFKRKFTYTTCTCPGSSGARVYCLGHKQLIWGYFDPLVHSGTKSELKYNYSGVGY